MSATHQTLARLVKQVLTMNVSYTILKQCVHNLEMVFPSEMIVYIHKDSRVRMICDLTQLYDKLIKLYPVK